MKYLITTALLVILLAPTARAQGDSEAEGTMMLATYNEICAPLPAPFLSLVGESIRRISKERWDAASLLVLPYVAKMGSDNFCAMMKGRLIALIK